MLTKRQLILNNIAEFCSDLLHFDRIEDEELGVGDVEKAIEDGEIDLQEMVDTFHLNLKEMLP